MFREQCGQEKRDQDSVSVVANSLLFLFDDGWLELRDVNFIPVSASGMKSSPPHIRVFSARSSRFRVSRLQLQQPPSTQPQLPSTQ